MSKNNNNNGDRPVVENTEVTSHFRNFFTEEHRTLKI